MSQRDMGRARFSRWGVCASLGLLLGLGGCGLDELEIPELDGPAELAISVRLTASPDILAADGFSQSLIQATVHGPNGELLAGRSVFMGITDEFGRTIDLGQLRSTGSGGIGTGLVLVTGGNGVAQASYEAPVRTDFSSNGSVMIQARIIGDDFAAGVYKSVRIELRAAEPRLFPVGGGLNCLFAVEPSVGPFRVNQVISFQTRSTAPTGGRIVRYEWFFGDGTKEDSPDTAKVYKFPGNYTVFHVVTSNLGAQAACSADIPVIPQ